MAALGVPRAAFVEAFAAPSPGFAAGSGTPSAAFAGSFGTQSEVAGSVFICFFFLSSRGLDHEPSTYIRAVRNGFFEKKLKNLLG